MTLSLGNANNLLAMMDKIGFEKCEQLFLVSKASEKGRVKEMVQKLQGRINEIDDYFHCIPELFEWFNTYISGTCVVKRYVNIKDLTQIQTEFQDVIKVSSQFKLCNDFPNLFGKFHPKEAKQLKPLLGMSSFMQFTAHTISNGVAILEPTLNLDEIESNEMEKEIDLDYSEFVKALVYDILPKYGTYIQENILRESDSKITDIQVYFGGCDIKYEIKMLEDYFNCSVPNKSKEALVLMQKMDQLTQKANVLSDISICFGIDMRKNPSQVVNIIHAILDLQQRLDESTLSEVHEIMSKLEQVTYDVTDHMWSVIKELSRSRLLIEFLNDVKGEDLRNLIDAVEEHSEEVVRESTISDLIQLKSILIPVLQSNVRDSLESFLAMLHACKVEETKDLPQMINNCAENCTGLKELYMNVACRGEVTKQIVVKMLAEGTTVSYTIDGNIVSTSVSYSSGKEMKSYNIEDLLDLQSRARLIANTDRNEKDASRNSSNGPTKMQVESRGQLIDFISFTDLTVKIANVLQNLYLLGHFQYQKYVFVSKLKEAQSKFDELHNQYQYLLKVKRDWLSTITEMRARHYYLNFVDCKQFHMLYNFLVNGHNKSDVMPILHFLNRNINERNLKTQSVMGNEDTNVRDKLEQLGQWLCALMEESKPPEYLPFPRDSDFQRLINNLESKVTQGEIYIAQLDQKSVQAIPIILSLYANTTQHFPLPHEIVFCDAETTWEDISLLVNRCISISPTKHSSLYCLVGVETLSYENQVQLVELIHNLKSRSIPCANQNYLLAVLCRSENNQILLSSFMKSTQRTPPMEVNLLAMCLQSVCPHTYMVTSDLPGLGKTELIESIAAEKGLGIVSVPINGSVSKKKLISITKRYIISGHQTLHLDIGSVDRPELLDRCIFELLVLGCIKYQSDCVHLQTQHVAIEVGNTVKDSLRNALSICSSFQRLHCTWNNFADFIVSEESTSSIQVVCRYLNALDNDELGANDVTLSRDSIVESYNCQRLLRKCFEQTTDDMLKNLSFTIVSIFLEVLADQLRMFSTAIYFRVSSLTAMTGDANVASRIRTDMINALVKISKDFSFRSISTCKDVQHKALVETKQCEGIICETDVMISRVEGMIQWSQSNHLLVIFQKKDKQTVQPLYRDLCDVPVDIKGLFEYQLDRPLPNFNEFLQDELQDVLEKMVCTSQNTSIQKRLGNIYQSYALTPDNILKMILIILRVRVGIPVILMGETGCGKTTLVKYLAKTCDVNLNVFPLHAGVTEIEIATKFYCLNNEAIKQCTKEYWFFLDEINACKHLGMLAEIICYKRLYGNLLAPNLVVIAACNPYRLRSITQIFTAGLQGKTKKDEFSKLVYRVHPLPEVMLDYVWDYGTLLEKDENSYIKRMVSDIDFEKLDQLLCFSQRHIREIEDNTAIVSLRDVHRCTRLIKWFDNTFLQEKKMVPNVLFENRKAKSILLALSHCYEVRMTKQQDRNDYWDGIASIWPQNSVTGNDIHEYVVSEQMDILNRLVLPEGIAKNSALRENVFVLFVCIMNRMPVFLIGKPGCSKSLSIQLLKSSLRGADSEDDYFKKLPQLYIVSYQGSESSTSEGIIKVFDRAKKYNNHTNKDKVLPVVLLDEVGLAEVSNTNPLKVLHALLEPDIGEMPEIAVVGISNWALDAAKMNRAIHLSRTELSVGQLLLTGKAIRDGLKEKKPIEETLLCSLAQSYFEYQKNQEVENFHGLRDFYSLIKHICMQYPSNHTKRSTDVIMVGIQRNFGGLGEKSQFITKFTTYYRVSDIDKHMLDNEKLIEKNLTDSNGRHLMLITNGDYSLGIIENTLKESRRKYEIIFGSQFDDDNSDDYNYRILSNIISCMEQGIVLILKNLNHIYGSLYDMLNQNYTKIGFKRYCRIALGAHRNPMCIVHQDFRCIVVMEESGIDYSDPPFLNRFEKQIVNFEDLLKPEGKLCHTAITSWVEKLSDIQGTPFKVTNAFFGYHKETVSSLVYATMKLEPEGGNKEIIEKCKSVLLETCPPDAILRLSHSMIDDDIQSNVEYLQEQYFNKALNSGIGAYLSNQLMQPCDTSNLRKILILTRTNCSFNFQNQSIASFPFEIWKLGSFKSEKQLSEKVASFFNGQSELLIVQCVPFLDAEHIPLLKLLIDVNRNRYLNINECKVAKHVIVIMHLNGLKDEERQGWQFDYSNQWTIVCLDHLHSPSKEFVELLDASEKDLITYNLISIDDIIKENILWSFSCLKYTYGGGSAERIWNIVNLIKDTKVLLEFIQHTIEDNIMKSRCDRQHCSRYDERRWQVMVAFDANLMFQGCTLLDAWKFNLASIVKDGLTHILYVLENTSSLNSFIDVHNKQIRWLADLWKNVFNRPVCRNMLTMPMQMAPESIDLTLFPKKLLFPFSHILLEKFDEVRITFWNQENVYDVETISDIETECLREICDRYSSMIEQRYEEHVKSLHCDSEGLERLTQDMCSYYCYSPRLAMEEDMCNMICLRYMETKYPNTEGYSVLQKLTLQMLTWSFEQSRISSLLQLASICDTNTQNAILNDLKTKGQDNDMVENAIIHEICQNLFPDETVLQQEKELSKWVKVTSQICTYSGKVSCDPEALHFLRFCLDIYATMLRMPRLGQNIFTGYIQSVKSEGNISKFEQNESLAHALESQKGFVYLRKLLQTHRESNMQRLFCLYFIRCLDANPDSPLLADLSNQLVGNMFLDGNMSFFAPVLEKVFFNCNIDIQVESYLSQEKNKCENSYIDNMLGSITFGESHPLIGLSLDIIESIIQRFNLNVPSISYYNQSVSYIAQAQKYDLNFLVSMACIRKYLEWCTGTIQKHLHDLLIEKPSYLQKVNFISSNPEEEENHVPTPMQLYLLKLMKKGSMKDLENKVKEMIPVFTGMRNIAWPNDEIQQGVGFSALCLDHYYEIAKSYFANGNVENIIMDIEHKPDVLPGAVALILEKYYWVRFLRELTDTEKQFPVAVFEKVNLNNDIVFFIKCIIGKETFSHKCLQVSSQWDHKICLQASVLLHLCTTWLQSTFSSSSAWYSHFSHDIKSEENTLHRAAINVTLQTTECKCNKIIFSKDVISICPGCNNNELQFKPMEAKINQTKFVMDQVVNLCVKGSYVAEEAVNRIPDINNELASIEYDQFRNIWDKLKECLDMSDKQVALFMHMIIEETKECHDLEEVYAHLQDIFDGYKVKTKQYHEKITQHMQHSKLFSMIEELGKYQPEKPKEVMFLSRLKYAPTTTTLQNAAQICTQSGSSYMFMQYIMAESKNLELLLCLPDILHWYLMVQKWVHHRVTRQKVAGYSINDFIMQNRGVMEENRKSAFKKFEKCWEVLVSSDMFHIGNDQNSIPEIHLDSPLKTCIVEDRRHILYRVMDKLVQIQNRFMLCAASVTLNGSLCLRFLENENCVLYPLIPLQTAQRRHFIHMEWKEDLLIHCQNSLDYGCGDIVLYNFEYIERAMADLLIQGKGYLKMDHSFPTTVYQNEIFHWSERVLIKIRELVQQETLHKDVMDRIKENELDDNWNLSLKNVLNILETIISLLCKTGGKGTTKLSEITGKWDISDQCVESDTLRDVLRNTSLKNIVGLYEFIEEEVSSVSVDSLRSCYNEKLNDEQKEQIEVFINLDEVILRSFLTAVSRFVVRYLSIESNDEKRRIQPEYLMKKYICRPSLWPYDIDENYISSESMLFPGTLKVKHTKQLQKYLYNLVTPPVEKRTNPINMVVKNKKRKIKSTV